MLALFQKFVGEAPEFNSNFLVFLPFTAVLQWPMSTASGFTILVNRRVNDQFRKIFAVWSQFLTSPDSASVLNEGTTGWLSTKAMEKMPDFVKTFECDPDKPHWGFTSWDHFFARKLRYNARPVEGEHDDMIITSACESQFLRQEFDVQALDKFWIKGQRYSLIHMLNDPLASSFVGGTVYQAFLSPYYYHRWHSPVAGTVVKVHVVDGTYFAGIPTESLPGPSEVALQGQQAFISQVATRALIFIQARNPKIGLMCFVAVGMVEVSSCEITVRAGQIVKKGQEIGTFHFGGSTHCLVFGPHVRLDFKNMGSEVIPVRSAIAEVKD